MADPADADLKLLALDTSTLSASVALLEGRRVVYECTLENGNTHSQNLMPLIDGAFAMAGWQQEDLHALAVTVGPGSFTGLRIGVATAKGLAMALRLPVAAVGTLDALAMGVLPWPGLIVPLLDARRDQVYTATFRQQEEAPRALTPPRALDVRALISELSREDEPVVFCGDGLRAHGPLLQEALGSRAVLAPACARGVRASAVGLLGLLQIEAGRAPDPATLVPQYLRRPQAKTLLEQRAGRG